MHLILPRALPHHHQVGHSPVGTPHCRVYGLYAYACLDFWNASNKRFPCMFGFLECLEQVVSKAHSTSVERALEQLEFPTFSNTKQLKQNSNRKTIVIHHVAWDIYICMPGFLECLEQVVSKALSTQVERALEQLEFPTVANTKKHKSNMPTEKQM